ncbi:MAG TPA: acetyl-CoA C-acyltransferase [Bryobacteraceae bacterium]|nr:acetyl-CoA C-acyltransferase [Bryobacteraceae bacterium]
MPDAVIVDCMRTAAAKAAQGALRNTRPDDLAAAVVRRLLERYPEIPQDEIDDVILGCAFPEAEAGLNLGRQVVLLAGLPDLVPGLTVNRRCASGLEAIATAADRIRAGSAHIVIAGGAESMSMVPDGGRRLSPNPLLVEHRPQVYLAMGLAAEQHGRRYGISREEQDVFALRSHRSAVRAQQEGLFDQEIVAVNVQRTMLVEGKERTESGIFYTDEGPAPATSLAGLAKLPPLFDAEGAVTAGNSALAADGAAAALVLSAKKARQLELQPRLRVAGYALGAVPPEMAGMGSVVAIPKALRMARRRLEDIGLIELNEASAAQSLAVIRLAGLDPARVNVNGGAIALGHPLGATGAKLTATLMGEMERRRVRFGMVTICAAGGQGAAAIFERL